MLTFPQRSQSAVAHLTTLNTLLKYQTEFKYSIVDYLLQRNFYSLLAQAIESIVRDAADAFPILNHSS